MDLLTCGFPSSLTPHCAPTTPGVMGVEDAAQMLAVFCREKERAVQAEGNEMSLVEG